MLTRALFCAVLLASGAAWGQENGGPVVVGTFFPGFGTTPTTAATGATAPTGILLDSFAQAGDADDTASLTRAMTQCATGMPTPIALGIRTYTINNFSSGTSCSNFVLKGIKGQSIIRRTSASGSNFFNVQSSSVVIDGVIFDSNSGSVSANQWGVFLGQSGQTIDIRNSVFKNNSGTLGSCLTVVGVGPSGGGSYKLVNDEFTGCATLGALYLGSVPNGLVDNLYTHDNSGAGIYASAYGTASSTNYLSDLQISNLRTVRNSQGAQIGGYSPPYSYATPPAVRVTLSNVFAQDNTNYQITLQGDYLQLLGGQLSQSSPSVAVFGGVDCNGRYQVIQSLTVTLSGSSYGIDCGGSIQENIQQNHVTVNSGSAINFGGNSNTEVSNNTIAVSGTGVAATIYEVEADGSGIALPTIASNIQFDNNNVYITGSSALGVDVFDNAGGRTGSLPTGIRHNHFFVAGSGSGPFQAISYRGASTSLAIDGNDLNGINTVYVDPNGNTDLLFDNVYYGGTAIGLSSTSNIRQITSYYASNYGAGGSILYVEPNAQGSGYVQSTTTLAASGAGCTGWTGTPLVYGGAIIGVRTLTIGSGCSGSATITATDTSGGTGATFSVGQVGQMPAYSTIKYQSVTRHLLQQSGAYVALTGNPILLDTQTAVSLQSLQSGQYWDILSFGPSYYTYSQLPTCNSTSKNAFTIVTDALAPAYGTTLSAGGGSVQVTARCNGSNWISD